MSDRFVETLKNIKQYCKGFEVCNSCTFYHRINKCLIIATLNTLNETTTFNAPCYWDMEKIEKLLEEKDA